MRSCGWSAPAGITLSVTAPRVVLDQRNLDFSPHILVVQVGTTVDFPNHDRVFHNVFSFHDGKKFDLGLYPVGTIRRSGSTIQASAGSSAISTPTWPHT